MFLKQLNFKRMRLQTKTKKEKSYDHVIEIQSIILYNNNKTRFGTYM